MPYSLPTSSRPSHRRSFSNQGAFASLGSLPRRTPATQAKFHINEDDEDSSSEDEKVPFPVTQTSPTRPTPSRTESSPILLSNGKPLKSSLKSSNSAPSIFSHLRAVSEPSTPSVKSVHFPQDLASVRVFNRSAKPASLLISRGLETETETETEGDTTPSSFPFPTMAAPVDEHLIMHTSEAIPMANSDPYGNVFLESLTLSQSSSSSDQLSVPVNSMSLFLHGSILLRNISYEKQVSVRFTLDGWDTTSEVTAKYHSSLTSPPTFLLPRTFGDLISTSMDSFDRFSFSVRLSDYLSAGSKDPIPLLRKELFLAVRYTAPGRGEWWDNCNGRNWGVHFTIGAPLAIKERERSYSAPAAVHGPASFLMSPPLHERGFSEPFPMPSTPPSETAQHKAVEQATNARLSKFSLLNYAAPKPRTPPTIPTVLPPTPPPEEGDDDTPMQTPGIPFPSKKEHYSFPSIHWPWGRAPDDKSPSPPRRTSPQEAQILSPPLPTPPLLTIETALTRSRSDSSSSDESSRPSTPSIASPQSPVNNPMESDILYKAFLREWCFGGEAQQQSKPPKQRPSRQAEWMGIEA